MKSKEIKIEDVLRLPPGSLKEMERTLDRVLDRLGSNDALTSDGAHEAAIDHSSLTLRPRWRQRIAVLAAAALVIAAAVIGVKWQSRYGTLETADGGSRWIFQRATFGETGGLLTLRDGSRAEIRAGSQVVLERAADGVRIRLNEGSIIVNAARQRQGHLYVQTKDMTVSVEGTVFVVEAEKAGSRVAVVEGEVKVREGASEKQLRPGEQVVTYPSVELHSIRERMSWSRHAEEHLALLQQAPTSQSVPPPQWQTAAGGKMSFEVASIRPSDERDLGLFPLNNLDTYRQTGGLFRASFPLRNYIEFAYKLSLTPQQRQAMLSQLPSWAATEYFAIQAKAPISNPTKDQMRLMVQSLLADRFKLALRFEMQEVPVFVLTLVKPGTLGPQIHPHAEGRPCPAKKDDSDLSPLESDPDVWPASCGSVAFQPPGSQWPAAKKVSVNSLLIAGRDVSMEVILEELMRRSGGTDRPIVDQTGLKGNFDFRLEYSSGNSPRLEYVPELNTFRVRDTTAPAPEFQGPPLPQALREQLGMKLEATRASFPVLVIDHVEKPSEN